MKTKTNHFATYLMLLVWKKKKKKSLITPSQCSALCIQDIAEKQNERESLSPEPPRVLRNPSSHKIVPKHYNSIK